MALILLTSSHGHPAPPHRPGCPPIQAGQANFIVNYEWGRTAEKVIEELKKKSFRDQFKEARLVVVALWGNDLTPDKRPSYNLDLAQTVCDRLIKIYILKGDQVRAKRVLICTLIPRPKYDQFHQYLIQKTNEFLKSDMGTDHKSGDTFNLHQYFKEYQSNWSRVFCDGIHLTPKGYKVWAGAIIPRCYWTAHKKSSSFY